MNDISGEGISAGGQEETHIKVSVKGITNAIDTPLLSPKIAVTRKQLENPRPLSTTRRGKKRVFHRDVREPETPPRNSLIAVFIMIQDIRISGLKGWRWGNSGRAP